MNPRPHGSGPRRGRNDRAIGFGIAVGLAHSVIWSDGCLVWSFADPAIAQRLIRPVSHWYSIEGRLSQMLDVGTESGARDLVSDVVLALPDLVQAKVVGDGAVPYGDLRRG